MFQAMRSEDARPLGVRVSRSIILGLGTLWVSALTAYVPPHLGLTDPGRHALFVLLTAASWWITNAVPAFAVSLAVIALQVALLGDPNGDFAGGDVQRWQRFVAPWASPVMWLFLSGLVIASAAARTGLDRRLAERVLRLAGTQASRVLLAIMAVTFGLSMFMSNTAATALMIGLVLALPSVGAAPPSASAPSDSTPPSASAPADPTQPSPVSRSTPPSSSAPELATALLLGIPVAANLGGMGTLIGSPPNAIAAAAIAGTPARLDFAAWMAYGLPPALLLGALTWRWIVRRYLRHAPPVPRDEAVATAPLTGRAIFVAALFVGTVLLWLTEGLHGIPTAVVAVMPIAILAVSGVVRERDVRALPWDVLVLIAGGLSLGVGVSETGLAEWLVGRLPTDHLSPIRLAAILACAALLLSTFISNTAAATILTPLALALAHGEARLVLVPLALAASAAMSLPVSTPPNAMAFATGRLAPSELRAIGLRLAVVAPTVAVGWTWLLERALR